MMNRRGILALLGGAAAMPTVGVKAAASTLGVGQSLVAGSGAATIAGAPTPRSGWWGSPLQIAFDAKERAAYRLDRHDAYPHMKSWGRAFRQSAVERDELIMTMYRRKMEEDHDFRDKVLSALGMKP